MSLHAAIDYRRHPRKCAVGQHIQHGYMVAEYKAHYPATCSCNARSVRASQVMTSKALIAILGLLAPAQAETVLGVTVFSRHGDSE